jgi:hemoglobin-like flavoprotein
MREPLELAARANAARYPSPKAGNELSPMWEAVDDIEQLLFPESNRNGAMMTPDQIRLVQSSWQSVIPIQKQAATLFYDELFAADPSLRTLFKGNLDEQKSKLTRMIGVAVSSLHRLEEILPAVKNLGRRHEGYGVRPQDYAMVGATLLGTLEKGLGPAFTPEVKEAWAAAYGLLSQVMQGAAAQAVARA